MNKPPDRLTIRTALLTAYVAVRITLGFIVAGILAVGILAVWIWTKFEDFFTGKESECGKDLDDINRLR